MTAKNPETEEYLKWKIIYWKSKNIAYCENSHFKRFQKGRKLSSNKSRNGSKPNNFMYNKTFKWKLLSKLRDPVCVSGVSVNFLFNCGIKIDYVENYFINRWFNYWKSEN